MIRNSFNKGKPNSNYIDTIQALELIRQETGIDITLPTLIAWARKYNLGKQWGGRSSKWYINKQKLLEHLRGNGR